MTLYSPITYTDLSSCEAKIMATNKCVTELESVNLHTTDLGMLGTWNTLHIPTLGGYYSNFVSTVDGKAVASMPPVVLACTFSSHHLSLKLTIHMTISSVMLLLAPITTTILTTLNPSKHLHTHQSKILMGAIVHSNLLISCHISNHQKLMLNMPPSHALLPAMTTLCLVQPLHLVANLMYRCPLQP